MTTDAETIGRRITVLRERSGLSLADVAAAAAALLPMTEAALFSIERGDRLPTAAESLAIATALGVAPAAILSVG